MDALDRFNTRMTNLTRRPVPTWAAVVGYIIAALIIAGGMSAQFTNVGVL